MKILGIIIVIICVVLNVLIGFTLLGFVYKAYDTQSENKGAEVVPTGTLSYRDTTAGISFEYPAALVIVTTAEDRKVDTTLVDILIPRGKSVDDYVEGIFIYMNLSEGMTFAQYIDRSLNNISANGFRVDSESDTVIDGHKVHIIYISGVTTSRDGSKFDTKDVLYLVDGGTRFLTFDFNDKSSTFDQNKNIFLELMNGVKLSK